MAISVVVDRDQYLATFTVRGPVQISTIIRALRQLEADPSYRPGMNRLWNFRDATVTLSSDEVRQLVALLKRRGVAVAAGRAALVMGSPLAYGIARMVQIYAEIARLSTEIAVFSDLDEALLWLGVREDRSRGPTAE
jgi:hypothetical protein